MSDELLTVEFFAPHQGERFRIRLEGGEPYELELVEAVGVSGDSDSRDPFSVLFRGAGDPVLTQRVYRLEHDRLAPLDLFLVPLGPDRKVEGTVLYEAAFS